jgi:hypothetical protein
MSDEVKHRLQKANEYSSLLGSRFVDEENDIGDEVSSEINAFIERRLAELMGVVGASSNASKSDFTVEEVLALKALAAKVMAPSATEPPPAPAKSKIKRSKKAVVDNTPREKYKSQRADLADNPKPRPDQNAINNMMQMRASSLLSSFNNSLDVNSNDIVTDKTLRNGIMGISDVEVDEDNDYINM